MKRHCITCGEITTQKTSSLLVCVSGHENWINPAIGSSVFVVNNDSVLYGVRSSEPGKGKLDLPGGFVEVGETAERAAIRETKEEVGLDIRLVDFLGTYATTYEGRPNLNLAFVGEIQGGEVVAGDDMGGGEPVWRKISDLPGPDEHAAEWFVHSHADFLTWRSARQQ